MTEKYRDGLFRDYFKDKVRLLSLCNALLGTDGTDPDEIEINTLDGIFFEQRQNDISCIYRGRFLVLIEQQSTINENMPLRCLFYVAEILKRYVEASKEQIYRKSLIKLPRPEIFVLYNGRAAEAERREMRLSEAFGGAAGVEVIVKMYNINAGMNEEFVRRSEFLNNYCVFVNRVKENLAAGQKLERAVEEAFEYCTRRNVMQEYLANRRWELISMLGFEYKEEDAKKAWIEYGIEQGIAQGITQGLVQGKIDTVKNLLAVKTPLEYITAATGWTKEQILKLTGADK